MLKHGTAGREDDNSALSDVICQMMDSDSSIVDGIFVLNEPKKWNHNILDLGARLLRIYFRYNSLLLMLLLED